MQKLRIAQIAPLIERVPPKKYGGTERVIHALTEELVKRGHDVTLFATGDSVTSAKLVSVYPKALREVNIKDIYGTNIWGLVNIAIAYGWQDQFDIIHDHTWYMSLPAANLSFTPVVVTLHGPLNEENRSLFEAIDNVNYVTISNAQRKKAPNVNYAANIYNALEMSHYPYGRADKGYLLYVGRISRDKGVHIAIKVAKALKLPLIIAAKLETAEKKDIFYYKRSIERQLSDQIRWVGEVDEKTRNKLMSNALCFLHPATWEEPFGLTLIEAMACGCPVVAFNRGSIPEVIKNGETGYAVDSLKEMIQAVSNIKRINRKRCREYSLTKFNVGRMADEYEKIYQEILAKEYADYPLVPDFSKKNRRRSLVYAHNIKVKV